jgi:hypothetical protein
MLNKDTAMLKLLFRQPEESHYPHRTPSHPQSAPSFNKRCDGYTGILLIKKAVNHRSTGMHFLGKLGLVYAGVPHSLLNLPDNYPLQRL